MKNTFFLNKFTEIPKQINLHQETDNLIEFVIHELCHADCFDIQKAAYIVSNPDFQCIKGIAGFHSDEVFHDSIWNNKETFSDHMKRALFNQKVRCIKKENCTLSPEELADLVAKELTLQNTCYYSIPLKNENLGLLVYESKEEHALKDYLENGFSLLSLCPLF